MWPNPQETADLVTFTEETLNRKLHFLCSDAWKAYASFPNSTLFKNFPNNSPFAENFVSWNGIARKIITINTIAINAST